MSTLPLLKTFCRECYSPPEAVYEQLKRKNMDLVTVSDHDSIDAAEILRRHPDFFVSEEVTCCLPSGTEVHVGVYDISDRQHMEIQGRRNDWPRLLAYLREQGIFFSVNHAFSSLTGRRVLEDFEAFERVFPAIEVLNGHILEGNNLLAGNLAATTGKAGLGGSDAHTLSSLGTAYTEVRGARNRAEFLEGLRQGRTLVGGESGSYWKLTRDVVRIGVALLWENPATLALLPLAAAIPLMTFINYGMERSFALRWGTQWEGLRGPAGRSSLPCVRTPSEEASA
jgi:predicted metal-dependent phosphoesterase TrpH